MNTEQTTVEIVSFGYGHGAAPTAHVMYDVREHYRDPHVDPELRYLTAEDSKVFDAVMKTPGIAALVDCIVHTVLAYRSGPTPAPVSIAVGCVGGRHRSAAVAIRVAQILAGGQTPVTLTHRDIARPVIARPKAPADSATVTAGGR